MTPEACADAEALGQRITDGRGPQVMKEGDIGNKGISAFTKALPYVCRQNFWVIQIAHALLLGVVKDFLHQLLPSRTSKSSQRHCRRCMPVIYSLIMSHQCMLQPYTSRRHAADTPISLQAFDLWAQCIGKLCYVSCLLLML